MKENSSEYTPIDTKEKRIYPIPELGPDVLFPSTTTILRLMAKPALIQWASNMSAEYAKELLERIKDGEVSLDEVMEMDTAEFVKEAKMAHKRKSEEAMDIGVRVHEFAHRLFMSMLYNPKEEIQIDCDKDIYEPCSALIEWIGKHDVKPVALEQRVWSKSFGGYAGTFDFVGFVDNKFLTLDIKTARNIYDDHPLQVASYDHAFEERNPGNETDGMMILRLDKEDGFPDPHFYTKAERNDYLLEFGYWCNIWHIQNRRKERAKEETQIENERIKELRKKLPKKLKTMPKEDPF